MPRQILFVAYYFPPAGGGGVQRSAKLVKYLPCFGWQPVILTVNPQVLTLRDESLLAEIPAETPIFSANQSRSFKRFPWRIRNFILRWLPVADEQFSWRYPALRMAKKIIAEHEISLIYTTSSPYTAHLIGRHLQRETGLPWAADFRDPWVDNYSAQYPTRFHRRWHETWENGVIEAAAAVISVSDQMRRAMQARYPQHDPLKFRLIPNGYDAEDFLTLASERQRRETFVIGYTGSLYGERQNPKPFFLGLKQFLSDNPGAKVQVRLTGSINPSVSQSVRELGLAAYVKISSYLTHDQVIQDMFTADVLLLIIGEGPGMEQVMTGKIFEYLAAGKPILAVIPPGAAADLLRHAGATTIVPPSDPRAISQAITHYYTAWHQDALPAPDRRSLLEFFERKAVTARLAAVFDQIAIKP